MATKLRISEQFNTSTRHIKSASDYAKQGDINMLQSELGRASTVIYSSLEWGLKRFLKDKFSDEVLHKKERNIIEASPFKPKFDLFKANVSPSFSDVGIDDSIIIELRQEVRNDPEHSGTIPHFDSLRKVHEEVKKILVNYICLGNDFDELPDDITADIPEQSNWSNFYNACDSFKDKNFILVIGPTNGFAKDKLSFLGLLNWSLILDFDPETENNGFYKNAHTTFSDSKLIHLLSNPDRIDFSTHNSIYWLAADGLHGRRDTQTSDYKSWLKKNGTYLDKFLTSFFYTFGDRPTNIVFLLDNERYVKFMCDLFYRISGDKVKFIFASPSLENLYSTINDFSGAAVSINIPQIVDGILRIRDVVHHNIKNNMCTLPAKDEEFVDVLKSDFLWVGEDFEILHRNILDEVNIIEAEYNERDNFYKGGTASWISISCQHDINRDKTNMLKKEIERLLKYRQTSKILFQHSPGIGGTTVSRRVVWDLKNDTPVLILKKFHVNSTVDKIYKIFELTKKSILVLVESSIVNLDDFARMYNELLSRSIPCVCLIVQRSTEADSNAIFMEDFLSTIECQNFVIKYKSLVPQKDKELEQIMTSNEKNERHPLYFGLTAFEENFRGLKSYIKNNLVNISNVQRKVMSIISICYYYGQLEVPSQFFSTILAVPLNDNIRLTDYLTTNLRSLLINNDEMWRPLHYLVAKELLIQLNAGNEDIKDSWKINLPDIANDIINSIATNSPVPSEIDEELLRRLFVDRNSADIIEKDDALFSNFMESGIQTDEARLNIFLALTNHFPDNPHYWAHLARFYSHKMKNHKEAMVAISEALRLSDNDSFLYHMKGMCLRAFVYEEFITYKGRKDIDQQIIFNIITKVDEASLAFDKCITINSLNEYGYISYIQMIISLIDFKFSISSYSSKTEFLRNLNPWLQEKLTIAESMLDELKFRNHTKTPNTFIDKCDIKLQELYENYSLIIEGWNNQLTHANNKPLIRRAIINAYVRRANSWDEVNNKDIEKILQLIEDNLRDEPTYGKNIHLWLNAARRIYRIDINTAIDKVSAWRAMANSDESLYYLGIMHTIQAIGGTSISRVKAEKIIEELSERKRNSPYRRVCYEWLGNGRQLQKIISNNKAVVSRSNNEIFFNEGELEKISGKISYIKGPEAGDIELSCGLKARFIPARAAKGLSSFTTKDLNRNVIFYLGFSYDGLRAFNVTYAD